MPDGTEGAYQHPSTRQDKAAHVASSHLRCDDAHCNICVGGLFCCIRCGSAEGATTSECPGVRMTADQADAVYGGKLDYRAGEWREEPSRYSPSGFASYMEALKSGKAWEQKEPGVPFMIEDMGMCPPGQFFFHAVPCTCKKGN